MTTPPAGRPQDERVSEKRLSAVAFHGVLGLRDHEPAQMAIELLSARAELEANRRDDAERKALLSIWAAVEEWRESIVAHPERLWERAGPCVRCDLIDAHERLLCIALDDYNKLAEGHARNPMKPESYGTEHVMLTGCPAQPALPPSAPASAGDTNQQATAGTVQVAGSRGSDEGRADGGLPGPQRADERPALPPQPPADSVKGSPAVAPSPRAGAAEGDATHMLAMARLEVRCECGKNYGPFVAYEAARLIASRAQAAAQAEAGRMRERMECALQGQEDAESVSARALIERDEARAEVAKRDEWLQNIALAMDVPVGTHFGNLSGLVAALRAQLAAPRPAAQEQEQEWIKAAEAAYRFIHNPNNARVGGNVDFTYKAWADAMRDTECLAPRAQPAPPRDEGKAEAAQARLGDARRRLADALTAYAEAPKVWRDRMFHAIDSYVTARLSAWADARDGRRG